MARQPRLVIPHLPHCVSQTGNNKQIIFIDTDDYQQFAIWLAEAVQKFSVSLHAYVFMPSYIRLLVTPTDEEGLARMMQWIGRHYVPYFNQKYQRTGTLWEGRFKTSIVDPDCQIDCSQFIELSPMTEQLTATAEAYAWSSYHQHIGMPGEPAVTVGKPYWALGNTPFERELIYKKRAEDLLSSKKLQEITQILQKSGILGEVSFVKNLEKQLDRKLIAAKRGRPVKNK